MVKLDASVLRHLTREHFRVLTAIEMGMKNHELVPTQLINTIAQLKRGGCFKALGILHKNKLIWHERKKCTSLGHRFIWLCFVSFLPPAR